MLTGTTRRGGRRARMTARQAARSGWLRSLARAGFAARGVMYILIGWIALQVAFGHVGRPADNSGALETVRSSTIGSVILWLLGIGFIGLALWRLAQAAFGGPDARNPGARLLALAKTVLYGFLAFVTLRYAVESGAPKSTNKQAVDLTAKLLRHPGGQVAVVVCGIVLIVGGLYLIHIAWRRAFLRDLETGRMTAPQRRLAIWFGEFGGISRGIVFAAAGVFLAVAGARHKPGKAKGIDATLRSFAHTPLGPWLLAAVAAGLVLFGVYSWFEARWRRV
jgi:hypothetical protein